jgi:8-oxo-dGTP diphosphatase
MASPTSARRGRTRIGAYAVVIRDRAILLARIRDTCAYDPGHWTLPGGGIEFGEHPEHAAVREAKEETGYDVQLGPVLTINSFHRDDDIDPYHGLHILYHAHIIGGELRHETDNTTDRAEWIPLDRIADYPLVDIATLALSLVDAASSTPTPPATE